MLVKSIVYLIQKFKLILSFLLIVLLTYLFYQTPFNRTQSFLYNLNDIYYPMQKAIFFVDNINEIYRENQNLRAINHQLQMENYRLRETIYKTLFHGKRLNFITDFRYRIIPGNVISFYPNLNSTSIIIDLGKRDSISKNMAVLDASGILGKITKTSQKTSLVQLISDPNSRISVKNPKTEGYGILKTDNGKIFYLEYINDHTKLSIGDTLFTSGLGGIYPKSIPVGKIISIKEWKFKKYPKIIISPFSNLNSPKEIFVIQNTLNEFKNE